jgi:nitrile hydratase accessory protein
MTQTYELGGEVAPPMANGELVFEVPWQGRAFGIARGLAEHGVYAWEDFRAALIDEIGAFDRAIGTDGLDSTVPTPRFHYYDHFLRALERLLVQRRIIAPGELVDRVRAFEDRPEGHDHVHEHHHDEHHHHDGHHHGEHRHHEH